MRLALPLPVRVVVAALLATFAVVTVGVQTADAAPPADHGTKQLAKQVAKAERALDRALKTQRTKSLSAETVAALQASAEDDKELLATYTTREELKGFRTVNYVLVVNVLRKAEKLGLTDVVTQALTVTATSSKADVRAVRAAFEAAAPTDDEADEPVEG